MVRGPISDASPALTDFGGEWKLTEVMPNHRIASLNPGEISWRRDRFFLCFSTRSSDVEFGGGGVWACEQDERGSGKRGGQWGKNAHPATELVGAGTTRSRSKAASPAVGSGEWKFTAACERLCMFKRSFLLTLFQRLTVARQKKSGRPSRGIPLSLPRVDNQQRGIKQN